jgi:ubiquinone/menaquinone biosynthesis C-methylase UbiE
MDKKRLVRDGYNRIALRYLARRSQNGEDVRLLSQLVARLPKGARVLDAGRGPGVPVSRLLSNDFEVVGVDFATE